MRIINKNHEYRYIAYNSGDGQYEEFKTFEEAKSWLTDNDEEGISQEAIDGENYIAEIQYRSVVTIIDDKKDYCTCDLDNEDCKCGKEEWPYSSEFDYIADHKYEKIEWED